MVRSGCDHERGLFAGDAAEPSATAAAEPPSIVDLCRTSVRIAPLCQQFLDKIHIADLRGGVQWRVSG